MQEQYSPSKDNTRRSLHLSGQSTPLAQQMPAQQVQRQQERDQQKSTHKLHLDQPGEQMSAQQMSAQRTPAQQVPAQHAISHKLQLGQPEERQRQPTKHRKKVRGDATFDGTQWSDGWPYVKFRDGDRGLAAEESAFLRASRNSSSSAGNADGGTGSVSGLGMSNDITSRAGQSQGQRQGPLRHRPQEQGLVTRVHSASGEEQLHDRATRASGRQEGQDYWQQQPQPGRQVGPGGQMRPQFSGQQQQQRQGGQGNRQQQPQRSRQEQPRGHVQTPCTVQQQPQPTAQQQQQQVQGGAGPQPERLQQPRGQVQSQPRGLCYCDNVSCALCLAVGPL